MSDLRAAAELVLQGYGHPDYTAANLWAAERLVARAYLREHRADDGEAVTEAWLTELITGGLWLCGSPLPVFLDRGVFTVSFDGEWEQPFPGVRTRGDVRTLLRLLGVEAKEVGDV